MTKYYLIVFVMFAFSTLFLSATTEPDTIWTQTHGGTNNENCYEGHQTSDGGFIAIGSTYSYGSGSNDIWLLKTDENGNEEWNQTFGGTSSDYGYSVQQTSDNGFIITGFTQSYGCGAFDIWLIKTDENGVEDWNQTFGGTYNDFGRCVIQTSDGGYLIGGFTGSFGAGGNDIWLIKTDENGVEDWNQTFGYTGDDNCYSVQQTDDNGYIIAGYTNSIGAGNNDFWLIKTNSNGNEIWSNTYGGVGAEYSYCVQQTSDNGYIMSGYTDSFGAGNYDFWLVKTDVSGNEEWNQTYGGIFSDRARWVIEANNGFLVIGYTDPSASYVYDLFLVKADAFGNEEWTKTIGDGGSDYGYCIDQTTDQGFFISGYTNSFGAGGYDFWQIKLDAEFEVDFSGSPTYGYYPELEVQFADQSLGNSLSWFWDFQNDGTYDSFVQNPQFTYTEVGTYDVKLKVTSGTKVDSLIINDYIEMIYVPPAPPTNVQITMLDDDAIISWSEVDTTMAGSPITVDYYVIRYSEDTSDDSLFYYLWSTVDTTFTHERVGMFSEQMLYLVESFIGTREELETYIEMNPVINKQREVFFKP